MKYEAKFKKNVFSEAAKEIMSAWCIQEINKNNYLKTVAKLLHFKQGNIRYIVKLTNKCEYISNDYKPGSIHRVQCA